MKTITIEIGSSEWIKSRSASKAAAVMGQDAHTTRNELLRIMATGLGKEFSEWQQKNLLDKGHETEIGARDIAEEILCDGLSPICGSTDDGYLTASFDGLTFDGRVGLEAKTWNEKLAAAVRAGEIPDSHWPQLEQQIIVGSLDYVLFAVTDGTRDNFASLEYRAVPGRAAKLLASWKQFDIDLANYTPPEIIPAVVAAPAAAFPTLFVQAKGEITGTNMPEFKAQITALLDGLNMKPTTDQEFADSKAMAKDLRECAKKTKALKDDMLAQTVSIGEVAKEIDYLAGLTNAAALALEKAVTAEEENRKVRLITRGQKALADHIAALNARLGKNYTPAIPVDFAGAIKGKRNLDSMENGIDTELARAKIASSEIADKIQINLTSLRELAADYAFLFADTAQIILKPNDDLVTLIKMRIAEHKAAEAKKEAEQRERIRLEEEAKAQAKVKAEQEEAERQRLAGIAAAEKIERDKQITLPAPANPSTEPAPLAPVPLMSAVLPVDTKQVMAAHDNGATMKLGEICNILGFTVTADFLAKLGFQVAGTEKNAKLYKQSHFPLICEAIMHHVNKVAAHDFRRAA